ncbi:MAG TPA: asparagine synthase (glutamine-hydrolyzing) [Planctomycetaceae bacterium]|nr:asparagine synthase (glutamine-hydrolyzing) [Planctomycetaceae bacterium]
MCGIFGIVGRTAEEALVRSWIDVMRHRGPDAAGVYCAENIVLAHRRLSIVDTRASADQPFWDPSGQTAVVFNGEIYNCRELRRHLESAGHIFRTSGDTEVLLYGYIEWGAAVVERLNGMFAFALYDATEQSLFLGRDRLGKKPLFLAHLADGALAFASELKPLLACGLVDTRVDPHAIVDYLRLNYVLSPRTMLQAVTQLSPGCCGLYRHHAWRTRRYWDLADHILAPKIEPQSARAATGEFDALLADATRIRLYSDVPLGAFLSGGVDSSTVVGMMRRFRGGELFTYSVEFAAAAYDESHYSRLASRHFQTRHHPEQIGEPVADELPEFARLMDVPLGDDSSIAMFQLARHARRSVTVCLTGDGADELFAGYATYQADRLKRWINRLRLPIGGVLDALIALSFERGAKLGRKFRWQQFRRGLALSPADAHYLWREINSTGKLSGNLAQSLDGAVRDYRPLDVFREHFNRVRDADWLDRFLYVDCCTWLVDDILTKVDRTSMAASLECRSPFLDHRVVEFAARLPQPFKLSLFQGKQAVRALARRLMPRAIVDRRKSGFNSPTDVWMRGTLRAMVQDVLSSGRLESLGLPWKGGIEPLWRQFLRGERRHQYSLWGLFMLGLWEREVLSAFPLRSQFQTTKAANLTGDRPKAQPKLAPRAA